MTKMAEGGGGRGKMPLPHDARHARLRWRCRRGMRELDAVLGAFLERHAASLTDADIAAFDQVLDLPDPDLYGYLLGRSVPTDPATAAFVARIRGIHS